MFEHFHKAKNFKDGHYSKCKQCRKNEYTSKEDVIRTIYRSQKGNSKQRGYAPPNYTLEELMEWCLKQPIFHTLYDDWVASNFNRKEKPSCDRLDDYIPYTLTNIQLTKFKDNELKGHRDRVNGVNNKASKAVIAYELDGTLVGEFHSINEGSRQTGIHQGTIHQLVEYNAGKSTVRRLTAGGLKWYYK